MTKLFLSAMCCLLYFSSFGQQTTWADETYAAMTLEEKVGQLFMIRAFSKGEAKEEKGVMDQIEKYHVGGICFFQGDPTHQVKITNKYQDKSKTPLLISIDGEWGLGFRFKKDAISFPRQLMLGAIQNNNLVYDMGKEIGSQLRRVGIHVNFAPVVDVNNNPNNPVINDRSFGEDKYNVISKGYAYMKGMQDMGVMACMKHFPGHGDTDVDSHYDLPVINYSRDRLDSIELLPFKVLSKYGMSSAMIAHLQIPSLDDRPHRPTTLSKPVVTDLLKTELNFNGLIYTDAMEMQGVRKHFPDGKADLEAFLAGCDVILLPNDIKKGYKAILDAVKSGVITEERLAHSVKKILRAKQSVQLHKRSEIATEGVAEYVNSPRAHAIKEELIENAITLVRDEQELVPIKKTQGLKVSTIAIGAKNRSTPFNIMLDKYITPRHHVAKKRVTPAERSSFLKKTASDDLVIVSYYDMSKFSSKNFGIDTSSLALLRKIQERQNLIIILNGSPYALKYFDDFKTILVNYNEEDIIQEITAQSLMGANAIKGRLPVTASDRSKYNDGIYRESLGRLGFSIPERVGMSGKVLSEMDELAEEMISTKAAPGGQVLVAKDGKIIWNKAYGHQTYDKKRPVTTRDIYDVASVTKTCASTISLMKLHDEGRLDLNGKIGTYLTGELDTCDKKDLGVRELLAHHAQLAGWIPFYKETMSDHKRNPKPLPKYYSKTKTDQFSIPVTDKLFMRNDYRDSIWSMIYGSTLRERPGYRYSDLAFYLFSRLVDKVTNQPIDIYADRTFYQPLGLRRTGYQPLNRFAKSEIAPTEEDTYFRKGKVHGHVHDMGAAMMGGVSGHAGLFSNAYELSIIMQMLLNEGSYGGEQYLKPSTIRTFTTRYRKSTRRGLGFDMKELDTKRYTNMSELASASTFGHLGFTGIGAFADPEYDLVFIFVTNRTYPNMNNNKFGKEDFRPRMQSIAYKAMMENIITP